MEKALHGICTPKNIKLKSNFLGPKSENGEWLEKNITDIFSQWCNWRRNRFPKDGASISSSDFSSKEFQEFQNHISQTQKELSKRFEVEVAKYSPRYMGHMFSEISLPALFGHIVGLIHNPNNTSINVSRVGLDIEKEAITLLGEMLGYDKNATGHFTSGGTIANIEGIWRARYRLDTYLSLGSYLNKEKIKNYSVFEAAHLGEESFYNLFSKHKVSTEVAKKFSFVINGPYTAFEIYRDIYNINFKGPILIVPNHKHYSWQKALSLMGLGSEALWCIEINSSGHLCLDDLKKKIENAQAQNRPILAVVSVAGTTELGMVDPVDKVQNLLDSYKKEKGIHIWHHIDAAYGGTYASMLRGDGELDFNLEESVLSSFAALPKAESITLDPHKLAMVPYACGAILVKDEACYHISQFDAPYLKESEKVAGKWNSTLEGSRASTGACATWMVAKSLGLDKNGMGSILGLGICTKELLEKKLLAAHPDIRVTPSSDTNIVCFTMAKKGAPLSDANELIEKIYEKICSEDEFAVSKTTLTKASYGRYISSWAQQWDAQLDTHNVVLIRMVLMNPFTISKENSVDYISEFVSYLLDINKSLQ